MWARKLVDLHADNNALAANLDTLRNKLAAQEAARDEAELKLAYAKDLQVRLACLAVG